MGILCRKIAAPVATNLLVPDEDQRPLPRSADARRGRGCSVTGPQNDSDLDYKRRKTMSNSIARIQPRTWYIAIALMAGVGLVSARSLALSANPNTAPGDGPATASAEVTPNTPGKSLGESMSKAFRDAAQQVLPSVVMITNTPNVVKAKRQGAFREGLRRFALCRHAFRRLVQEQSGAAPLLQGCSLHAAVPRPAVRGPGLGRDHRSVRRDPDQ